MSSRIEVVGGRRRWSVDQKLAILREAFGPDGSVSATCQRHAIGSGMLYTWRRQALSGDLMGAKRTSVPSFAEVEVSVPAPATAGSGHIGIELPSGVRLTVDAAVDTDALARVMSVLAR
jgi:transposase